MAVQTEQNIKVTGRQAGESLRFARDIIWVTLAQLFNSIILGIVTMPAITKSYGPGVYGIWVQINVTLAILGPTLSLQLGQALVRFLANEEDIAIRRKVLGSTLSIIVLISGLVLLMANLAASQFSSFFFGSPEYTLYIRLTFLWLFINVLFNYFMFYFRARNKIRLLSVRQVAVSTLTMAAVIGLASNGFDFAWIIISALSIQAVFTLMFYIMIVFEVGFPKPNLTGLGKYLAFSLPQMPGGILLWLIRSSDRYFITHFLGLSQTGIYSSSYMLANLTNLFYMPIAFVLYPLVSKLWEQQRVSEVKSYLEYSTRVFLALAIPAAAGITLLSQPLLGLLTTSEFLAGDTLVLLLAFGTVFLGIYQINVNIIFLVMKTKILPLIVGAASATSILVNIILIPKIGILGAGLSNITAYFVLAIIVTIWGKKSIDYRIDYLFIGKVAGATAIMALCLYFLRLDSLWDIALGIIVGAAVFVSVLFLLKGFSTQDKRIIKRIYAGMVPSFIKKR